MTFSSLIAGACLGQIANDREGIALMFFIAATISFVIAQIRGIEGIFDRTWKKILWPFLTLLLLFLATIPGKMAIPLYNQSSQVDFVGIGFFSFSFILLQAISIILININIHPHTLKVK